MQFQFFFILLYRVNDKKMMKVTEQTKIQLERAIRKIAEKFPADADTSLLTDIHLRVTQESGELMAFDDDDNEIMRCIIEQWIDNKDDDFYEQITSIIRKAIEQQKAQIEALGIMKPYSLILEDEEKEPISELYVVDDDMVIIDPDLMEDLDKDLDDFLEKLLKD